MLVQFWQPFTILCLPSGENIWIYLEIALWASFSQGLVLLHWNRGEFSPCSRLGLDQTPVCLPFRQQHCSSAPALPGSGNPTGSVPKLGSALRLPMYPALPAALPCHRCTAVHKRLFTGKRKDISDVLSIARWLCSSVAFCAWVLPPHWGYRRWAVMCRELRSFSCSSGPAFTAVGCSSPWQPNKGALFVYSSHIQVFLSGNVTAREIRNTVLIVNFYGWLISPKSIKLC